MAGILVALVISGLLLYLFEKKSRDSLGFMPSQKRLIQFAYGFFISGFLCAGVVFFEIYLKAASWSFSDRWSWRLLADRAWWDFKSVLTEELVFRGALLLMLINRLGDRTAILISATAFGVYHWFSFGIFGSIFPMFFVFVGTGLMGYAWALAFSRTRSIFLPLGLHFGWNFTHNTVFSRGPLGEGLMITNGGHPVSDWYSLIGLWLVPLIMLLFVKYWINTKSIAPTNVALGKSGQVV